MIKAVIFDFDGTLADTGYILYKAYERLADKHGLKKLSPEEMEEMKSWSIKDRFRRSGVPLFKLPRLAREALVIYGEFMSTAAPFPGIPELLQTLKNRGLLLCIISSNSAGNINGFLSAHRLELFDQVCSTSSLFGKHRAINRVIEALGIETEEAIYVGDELRDINACKKVPVGMIAVSWGYDHRSLLEEGGPDFIVDHPCEIARLVSLK